ncbi:mitochondrial splicing system protein [Serendipita sp. 401]|nr:mitochondrial splicing system protein [Serendipita sp. 401]
MRFLPARFLSTDAGHGYLTLSQGSKALYHTGIRISPTVATRKPLFRSREDFTKFPAQCKSFERVKRGIKQYSTTLPLSPAQQDTIYALSTPPGRGGVAVIRISGPSVKDVYHTMIRRTRASSVGQTYSEGTSKTGDVNLPIPWKMHLVSVVDSESEEMLDEGLAVYFKAPKSFTTEDVLELHVHSGRAILSSILHSISKLPGCRLAAPGEFTRRAFDAGRMDLTQVEGLRDLIDAETDEQRRWALGTAKGAVRDEVEALRQEIIACLMLCEAEIDFGDTEEIDGDVVHRAKDRAIALTDTLKEYLRDSRKGEIMRSGIRVVIFGEPNAGKSSLLNWLAQRQAAIVTPVPGTTRDILEVAIDLGGLPIIACDTAGLRETHDAVELIGVERAKEAIRQADIALCVVSIPELEHRYQHSCESSLEKKWPSEILSLINSQTLVLLNKVDLATAPCPQQLEEYMGILVGELRAKPFPVLEEEDAGGQRWWWSASVTTGEGMQRFVDGLLRCIRKRLELDSNGYENKREPLIRHARQRMHMENAVEYLEQFIRSVDGRSVRYLARSPSTMCSTLYFAISALESDVYLAFKYRSVQEN